MPPSQADLQKEIESKLNADWLAGSREGGFDKPSVQFLFDIFLKDEQKKLDKVLKYSLFVCEINL